MLKKHLLLTITNTSQVLRIHGVHSERRVLAKVTKDLSNCFGCGDVTLSIPVALTIPICCVKKNGSCEYFIKYKNTHQIEPRDRGIILSKI
jgi:hypothetical protein